MAGTREQRRAPAVKPGRGARAVELHTLELQGIDAVGAALSYVGISFRESDEVAVDQLARFAMSAGASLADVADVVLGEVAVARAGDDVLRRTDAELRARRALCRLAPPATGSARPVLWCGDVFDALSTAFQGVLEASGARLRCALALDPADLQALVWGQRWECVVVDHTALRRSARRAREVLAPLLAVPQRCPVVVTTDEPGELDAALERPERPERPDRPERPGAPLTTWVPRDLRRMATACGVLVEDPLTERERDVLRAVAEGRSNEQIGRQLSLSLSTVKTYLERIHGKLGSVDRASAVAVAVRGGWL